VDLYVNMLFFCGLRFKSVYAAIRKVPNQHTSERNKSNFIFGSVKITLHFEESKELNFIK